MHLFNLTAKLSSFLSTVERLTTFNNNNLQEFSLAPNKSVQSFKDNLFFVFIPFHNIDQQESSFFDILKSWEIVIGEVGFYTISPSEAISGTYICRGKQETGNRDANVTINVQGTHTILTRSNSKLEI